MYCTASSFSNTHSAPIQFIRHCRLVDVVFAVVAFIVYALPLHCVAFAPRLPHCTFTTHNYYLLFTLHTLFPACLFLLFTAVPQTCIKLCTIFHTFSLRLFSISFTCYCTLCAIHKNFGKIQLEFVDFVKQFANENFHWKIYDSAERVDACVRTNRNLELNELSEQNRRPHKRCTRTE